MKNFYQNHELGFNCSVAVIVLIILTLIVGYKISCVSAKVYNGRNNTSYSCSDFFWASDQINTQTQTLNLNVKN